MWQNRGLGRTLFIVEIFFISVVYFVHVRIPYTKYSLTVTDLINVLNFKYTYVFNAKRIKRLHGSPIKFEPIFDLLFYPFHCQDHLKVKVQRLCSSKDMRMSRASQFSSVLKAFLCENFNNDNTDSDKKALTAILKTAKK